MRVAVHAYFRTRYRVTTTRCRIACRAWPRIVRCAPRGARAQAKQRAHRRLVRDRRYAAAGCQ
ncbi:hypothetical protein A2T82_28710 [Burkholderia cenocepacia]|nr:hypothetical protein A2T82_28710 [Burkholderia cenocepacia]